MPRPKLSYALLCVATPHPILGYALPCEITPGPILSYASPYLQTICYTLPSKCCFFFLSALYPAAA
jgi:hypothetical protein